MNKIKTKQVYCIKCGHKQTISPSSDHFTCEKCQQSYEIQRFGGIVLFFPVEGDQNDSPSVKLSSSDEFVKHIIGGNIEMMLEELDADWNAYEVEESSKTNYQYDPSDIARHVCVAIKKSNLVTEVNDLLPLLYMAYLENGVWTGDKWIASLIKMKEKEIIASLDVFFASDELSSFDNNFFLRRLPNFSEVNEIKRSTEKNLTLLDEENQTELIRIIMQLTDPEKGFDLSLRIYLCSEFVDIKDKALNAALSLAENFSEARRWEKYAELYDFLSDSQKKNVDSKIDDGLQSLQAKGSVLWQRGQEDSSEKSGINIERLLFPVRLIFFLSFLDKARQNKYLPEILKMLKSADPEDFSHVETMSLYAALESMEITELDDLFPSDVKTIVQLEGVDFTDIGAIQEFLSDPNLEVFFRGEIAYRLIQNNKYEEGFDILESLRKGDGGEDVEQDNNADSENWIIHGFLCLPYLPQMYQQKLVEWFTSKKNILFTLSVASYMDDKMQYELIAKVNLNLESLTEIKEIQKKLIPLVLLPNQTWHQVFSVVQSRSRELTNSQIIDFVGQFEEEQCRESIARKQKYQEETFQDDGLVKMVKSGDIEEALEYVEGITEYETWGRKYPRASTLANLIPYIERRGDLFRCLETVEEMKLRHREGIRMAKIIILSRLADEEWANDRINYYLESFLPGSISEYNCDPKCLDDYPKSVLTVLGKVLPFEKWETFHRILNELYPSLRLDIFQNLFSNLPKKFLRQMAGFYAYLPVETRNSFFNDFFKAKNSELLNQKDVQSFIIHETYIEPSDTEDVKNEILAIQRKLPENQEEFEWSNVVDLSGQFYFQHLSLIDLARKYFELWQHENSRLVYKEVRGTISEDVYPDYSNLILHNLFDEAFLSAERQEAIDMTWEVPVYALRDSFLENIDNLPRIYYPNLFKVAEKIDNKDARQDLLNSLYDQNFEFSAHDYYKILLDLLRALSERPLDEFLGDLVTLKPLFERLGGPEAIQIILQGIKDVVSDNARQ